MEFDCIDRNLIDEHKKNLEVRMEDITKDVKFNLFRTN